MSYSSRDWLQLLDKLRIRSIASDGMTGVCPVCSCSSIIFYPDPHLPILRYHSRCSGDCRSAGDLLDLVARLRKVSLNLAFEELVSLSPEIGKQYLEIREQIEKNRKISQTAQQAWRHFSGSAAEPAVLLSTAGRDLLKKVSIPIRSELSWASAMIAEVLGYADSNDFESWMRLEDPTAKGVRIRSASYRWLPANSSGALIMPIRATPDLILGFQIGYMQANRWISRTAIFPYEGQPTNGLVGHPEIFRSARRVIVSDDYRVAMRAYFMWAQHHKEPCAILAITGNEGVIDIGQNLQALADREVIFWSPTVKPSMLRLAATLGAKISTAGCRSGSFPEWLSKQDITQIMRRVINDASVWGTAVSKVLTTLSYDQCVDLIQQARLTSNEIEQAIDGVEGDRRSELQRLLQPSWPFRRIAARQGIVEQRANGWWYLRGNTESLITDSPYRVLRGEVDSHGRKWFQIQVRYRGADHFLRVSMQEMTKSPATAVTNAMVAAGVGVPAIDPSWERYLQHVSLQLYAETAIDVARPTGVDTAAGVCRFTQFDLDGRTGELKPSGRMTVGSLLPAAGGRPVTADAVRQVLANPFVVEASSAFAAQLLSQLRLESQQPLVALETQEAVLIARKFLAGLMTLSKDLDKVRSVYPIFASFSTSESVLFSDTCLWAAVTPHTSLSMATRRPIYRPSPSSIDSVDFGVVQEIILALVVTAVRRFRDRSVHAAISASWKVLLRAKEIVDVVHPELQAYEANWALSSIINESLRESRWVSSVKQPSVIDSEQIWFDKRRNTATFVAASINNSLRAWRAPRVDLVEFLHQLAAMEQRVLLEQVGIRNKTCWQVSLSALDAEACQLAAASRRKNA